MGESKLSSFCSKVLEVGWLLAVVITPLFFNVHSTRVFEPDKLTMLRSIAVIMAAAWAVKRVEEWAGGRRGTDLTWRTPLVLPTLVTVAVYLASTALSLVPRTSLFGSYQRLQGTYTTLSYIVVFLVAVQELRTRRQLNRLMTVVILNSLPIALYGFLQRSGLDPLPWAGDTETRITSSMGNPIFIAAYLIMAALPTLARVVECFRAILTDEETGAGDVIRASCYIFILLVQLISIWFSFSRGPLVGLVAGLAIWAFLGLLTLQRTALAELGPSGGEPLKDLGRGTAFAFGVMGWTFIAALIVIFVSRWVAPEAASHTTIGAIGALVVFLGTWMGMIVTRRGWRWLWFSAVVIAAVFAFFFLAINLVEPMRDWAVQQPWLGRLADVLQSEGGTGKVRSLIWEGSVELLLPHEPIEAPPTMGHPDGYADPLNALRPLIGYGPESMYVAYNDFYPPELGHYESRTASPDRAHNETFDSLIITGLAGFSVYVWVFGATFYFGLRWLGLLPGDWRRRAFFGLLVGGALLAVAVVVPLLGVHFIGLAIPIGMVAGLLVYLVLYAFTAYGVQAVPEEHPHALLLMGVLAAIVAHLVEINFGIAIAATRTTFWVYLAVFVVAGHGLLQDRAAAAQPAGAQEQEDRRRRRRRRRRTPASSAADEALTNLVAPTLAAAILCGFVLGTLVYDFTTNTQGLEDGLAIMGRMLTGGAQNAENASVGLLLVFGLTWLVSGAVFISEIARQRERSSSSYAIPGALLLFLAVSLLVVFCFSLLLGDGMAQMVRNKPAQFYLSQDLAEYEAAGAGTELSRYYVFVVAVVVMGAAALYFGDRPAPLRGGHAPGGFAVALVMVLAVVAIPATNVAPIRADIIQKRAAGYESGGYSEVAVGIYQAAIDLVPYEDRYYLDLGRAYLDWAVRVQEQADRDLLLERTEEVLLAAREISPLNTDHSANLARMYRSWSGLTSDTDLAHRLVEASSQNYEYATSLSPRNVLLINEWAVLQFYYLGDEIRYQELISRSLELDGDYDETWMIQADVHLAKGEAAEAIPDLEAALGLDASAQPVAGRPHWHWSTQHGDIPVYYPMASAWYAYGQALMMVERYEDAIAALETFVASAPTVAYTWDCHRLLAIAYARLQQPAEAILNAQTALTLAPEEHVPGLQALLMELQGSTGE